MGRPKKELKRIHARKVKKSKQKLKLFSKGELKYQNLTHHAKNLLKKRKRKELKSA
jgi:hypothetical protein